MQPHDPSWLSKVNFYRAWSGQGAVAENPELSYGDVASGTSFADGLAAGALAARHQGRLLLIDGADPASSECGVASWSGRTMGLRAQVSDALGQIVPSRVAVAGGPTAVCTGVLGTLAYATRP